ncbi:hypothetical protein GTN31_04245 [Macrococcoides canis]|uniref:hypothetical protein n=1 Tax=Macrococcoides canis TaxID=1855823 RepID=UPI0013E90EF6|nr:hypothetical protein [Macrococcus canis]QIH75556.1 hypothetical protein GTN31_04245 [Macrococcus canis]
MNIKNINSQLFNMYLHILPIGVLLSAFFTEYYIQLLLLSLLTVITLVVNIGNIKMKILIFYLSILVLIIINLLFTDFKSYVGVDSFNLILFSIIPIILISSGLEIKKLEESFNKTFLICILYLLIGYILRKKLLIDYFDLGIITHFNVIILLLSAIIQNKLKPISFILLVTNVFVGLLLGSRMVSIASLILLVIGIGLVYRDNKLKNKFWYAFVVFSVYIIYSNIINILNYISGILEIYGINSRNITLFKQQISNVIQNSSNDSQVYSGRESIYPRIIEFLKEDGLLPNGLSMGRILTNNMFYHSHNFVLEILLIFGLILGILILIIFIARIAYVFLNLKTSIKFLILLLCISFFIRSMTGTYFIKDYFFWAFLALILFFKEENIYEQ